MVGSQGPKTMRVCGKVRNQEVNVLIALGSTHNFLDPLIIERATLAIKRCEKVRVRVANGEQNVSEGKCAEMKFRLQGNMFSIEVHVLVLAGCNMVLVVQWLKELGPILWDFVN